MATSSRITLNPQRAIAEMLGADLLVVFQGSSFNAQIPAKIYEYLRTGRPVFAVVDPSGDTAAVLHQFPLVYVADISSGASVGDRLEEALGDMKIGAQEGAAEKNIELVRGYSRKEQTNRLVKYFNNIESR